MLPNFLSLKEQLIGFLIGVMQDIFAILYPFITYGCKIVIVVSFIIFVLTQDKRYISSLVKYGIIFILFIVVTGGINLL